MHGLVQRRDRGVSAIDGQRVLDEVVGADAQEFHLAREQVGGHRGGGGFDHRPHGDVGAALGVSGHQRLRFARHDSPDLADLVDAGDEREQHAQVGVRGGAQERAELRDEDLGALQAQPQAAQAQHRVGLGALEHFVEVLLPSQVEGADDDRMRGHARGEVAIGPEVVFFVGEARCAGDVEELRSVQADPVGAEAHRDRSLVGKLDVRAQRDRDTVLGDGGQVARRLPRVLARHRQVVLEAGLGQARRIGVDHHLAAVTVDDDDRADPHAARDVAQPDDGGKAERLRQDRAVAGGAALVRRQPDHTVARERHRVRRADRLRHDDDRPFRRRRVGPRHGLEQPREAALEVAQVPRAVAKVKVFDVLEAQQVRLDRRVHGERRRVTVVADAVLDFGDQHGIVDEERLRVEDRRVAFAQGRLEP